MEKNRDDNSKNRILAAATTLFAKKGFDGTSIREICKAADVNICMISYYWGGKQELYQGIIDNLIENQIEYSKSFLDLNKNPYDMTKEECRELLSEVMDKFVDFFYTNISSDLIVLLLKEQQKPDFIINSPVFDCIRSMVARILEVDKNDRLAVFKMLFMLSQINSPRILPAFSLRLLGEDDFCEEDIIIIKDNLKSYISSLSNEKGGINEY